MNLFIDTNILIDLMANREPFSNWAYKIFRDQKLGKWKLFTSSTSIITTYYLLSKDLGENKARQAIKILLNRIDIIPTRKVDLESALITKFNDYEDSVQHEIAKSKAKMNYIITRNKKDFKHSIIEVLSSEELYVNEK